MCVNSIQPHSGMPSHALMHRLYSVNRCCSEPASVCKQRVGAGPTLTITWTSADGTSLLSRHIHRLWTRHTVASGGNWGRRAGENVQTCQFGRFSFRQLGRCQCAKLSAMATSGRRPTPKPSPPHNADITVTSVDQLSKTAASP